MPTAESLGGEEVPAGRGDVLRLRLPAQPQFGQIAAVTALRLASRRKFSAEEARVFSATTAAAVDCLLGTEGRQGRLAVEFEIRESEILVKLELLTGKWRRYISSGRIPSGRILAFSSRSSRFAAEWGTSRNQIWFVSRHT